MVEYAWKSELHLAQARFNIHENAVCPTFHISTIGFVTQTRIALGFV